jgi:hypothetical protein
MHYGVDDPGFAGCGSRPGGFSPFAPTGADSPSDDIPVRPRGFLTEDFAAFARFAGDDSSFSIIRRACSQCSAAFPSGQPSSCHI